MILQEIFSNLAYKSIEFQSESNHAPASKRATKSNEGASLQEVGVSSKRKLVQSTLPDWMESMSPIASNDVGQSAVSKRVRTQSLGAIVRKQNNEPPMEKSNPADKLKSIATTSTQAENDKNNERTPTDNTVEIAENVTSAQKNKVRERSF